MSTGSTNAGFMRMRAEESLSAVADELDYSPMVAELRVAFEGGRTKRAEWRKEQLRQMQKLIVENHEEITATVLRDLGGAKMRGLVEFPTAFGFCEDALEHLDDWMRPEKVPTPMTASISGLGSSSVRSEAKGVVLIVCPWNAPFMCCFDPMMAAISAGNCVVVKPSEISKHSCALITNLVEKYMDPTCIRVINGAVPETTALLRCHWDHIFYTGNGAVARIIMKAASENLTPVTLELGGKSTTFVDKTAKMDMAVQRIRMKFLNAGQICVAPDHVLIHKDREAEFVATMKQQLEAAFGPDPKANQSYGRIINASHVQRLANLLEATEGEVVHGGLETVDPEACYFPPTIVRNAKMGEPLLTEEIFGPILPIVTYTDLDEAIAMSRHICKTPLALYIFSEDQKVINHILDNTLSGGASINTAFEHAGNHHMPFGGVGSSGMGNYHGKYGFNEFSHKRAVLHQDSFLFKGSPLPDNPSDIIYDMAVKAQVTGFLSDQQRKVGKIALSAGLSMATAMLLRSKL